MARVCAVVSCTRSKVEQPLSSSAQTRTHVHPQQQCNAATHESLSWPLECACVLTCVHCRSAHAEAWAFMSHTTCPAVMNTIPGVAHFINVITQNYISTRTTVCSGNKPSLKLKASRACATAPSEQTDSSKCSAVHVYVWASAHAGGSSLPSRTRVAVRTPAGLLLPQSSS
jgi:hypothetical protein